MTTEAAGLGLAGVRLTPEEQDRLRNTLLLSHPTATFINIRAAVEHIVAARLADQRTWLRAALTSPEVVDPLIDAAREALIGRGVQCGRSDVGRALDVALAAVAETLGAK